MARAIIRCSLTQDTGSAVRNAADKILTEQDKFKRIGTFSYEGTGTEAELLTRVQDVLELMKTLPAHVSLNHVWLNVDQGSN